MQHFDNGYGTSAEIVAEAKDGRGRLQMSLVMRCTNSKELLISDIIWQCGSDRVRGQVFIESVWEHSQWAPDSFRKCSNAILNILLLYSCIFAL